MISFLNAIQSIFLTHFFRGRTTEVKFVLIFNSFLFEVIFFFALMQKRNKKNQGCEKKS